MESTYKGSVETWTTPKMEQNSKDCYFRAQSCRSPYVEWLRLLRTTSNEIVHVINHMSNIMYALSYILVI